MGAESDYIVKDSSIWKDKDALMQSDYAIRIGIVREHIFIEKTQDTRYIVEVWKNNRVFPMTCVRTSRFGGVYNYEEFNLRGFNPGKDNVSIGNYPIVPGDMVVVAASNGNAREGIIIGSLNHFARDQVLPATGDIAYVSEFNGINITINKLGEHVIMFKGLPTNLSELSKSPDGSPIPPAEYNEKVGGTFCAFDETGSYTMSDNAISDPQTILINKPEGKIIITSGKTNLIIDKVAESYSITNKTTTFDSADSWNLNTKTTNIKSTNVNVTASNIKTKGEWKMDGNMEIKGDIKQTGNNDITGNFSNTGTASLAGGANPIVYDIVLTIGTGNLGAPVISSHVFLKTVKTKAT